MYRHCLLALCLYVYLGQAVNAAPTERYAENGGSSSYLRVVRGETIDIQQAPYQISLLDKSTGSHVCGGTILSRHWVLTAAHCVVFRPAAEDYTVRSGSSFTTHGGQLHDVVQVLMHEDYLGIEHGAPVNDIALLRVEQPFVWDDTTKKVDLFDEHDKARLGSTATVTGWGMTEEQKPAVQLQSVDLTLLDLAKCHEAYEKLGGGIEGQICAAHLTDPRDMCDGDSGGPLMIGGRQVGIVSYSGPGCALPDYPGVYTEVAYYRAWIEKHTN
ncbi:hypothetical protein TKK_0002442 [Trichogramma kaykai]|uniref:chymotrypsin n=1 Tax=Trichogramma kaykai TaxID=54128 RepID=A0ABD2VWQ1_9HYME